ncbi:hypothetical protein AB0G29_12930 [Streptomyces parvus]|uniref:hypothetical protein n=1 Tax=Streptomyces parvus TaxID=66428 RepID=UPI0033C4E252
MRHVGMWDLIRESAAWRLSGVTIRIQMTESRPGVRFVIDHRHYAGDEFPTQWAQPDSYSVDERGDAERRFNELLDTYTNRHGEPTERAQMIDPRYHADRGAVLREVRFAGLEISESDVVPSPETKALTVHGMLWWEWLEAMVSE